MYKKLLKNKKGFTLIELLIVISIIGILFGIVILNINSARNKALIRKAEVELNQIIKAIQIAIINESKVLMEITGSGCSECNNLNLSSLDKIYNAAQIATSSRIYNDPWGSLYSFDENELEAFHGCNTKDRIRSTGKDKIGNTADDIGVDIPFYKCNSN